MEQNVGSSDSFLRVLLGAAFWVNILALGTGVVGTIILFLLGALMFFTADKHYCFLYNVFNFSSAEEKAKDSSGEAPAAQH